MPTPTPSPTAWTNLQHAASTAGAGGVNVDGIITIVIVAASVLAGVLGLSQMSRSKKITQSKSVSVCCATLGRQ